MAVNGATKVTVHHVQRLGTFTIRSDPKTPFPDSGSTGSSVLPGCERMGDRKRKLDIGGGGSSSESKKKVRYCHPLACVDVSTFGVH